MRHGTGDGRGRHRRRNSPESKAWLEIEPKVAGWAEPKAKRNKFGIPVLSGPVPPEAKDVEPPAEQPKPKPKPKLGPAPAQPPWMDAAEYEALVELRKGLA